MRLFSFESFFTCTVESLSLYFIIMYSRKEMIHNGTKMLQYFLVKEKSASFDDVMDLCTTSAHASKTASSIFLFALGVTIIASPIRIPELGSLKLPRRSISNCEILPNLSGGIILDANTSAATVIAKDITVGELPLLKAGINALVIWASCCSKIDDPGT
ncbi:hypothetical protein AWRI1631_100070 [Saccharomyces cerevisiae AWRI1631]|uniref:Uncharacterized protein n=1 Tax=Saccharomyces cerevisiae (strain AWRI1631) TaxID=545124 RepID=B5VKY4_YEAS6|nr:hypothetical protein AWRI1631_100070 [Saccharomyces cerevisiae AWRI1631]